MKKQNVLLCIILLAGSALFFACGNTATTNTGALEFDSLTLARRTHLLADTANPACDLRINLHYAASSNDDRLTDSLNTFIVSTALSPDLMEQAPAQAVEAYAARYARTYLADIEPLFKEELKQKRQGDDEGVGAWYNYHKTIEGDVQLYKGQLLVYRTHYTEYTGGAHGIYTTNFLNIDLRTLQPLMLSDLFAPDSDEALADLLWNQLMADHRVTTREELEEMGYASTGDLKPTENFYLSPEGITFHYNVYEITPYVMGETEIRLPYEATQHLMIDAKNVLSSLKN